MGYAMAGNIRKKIPADATLYINDINSLSCERFRAEYSSHGPIEIVKTAREAAENARVLISIVPGGQDVKKVYLDEKDGVIAAKGDQERLMLEASTIDVESTKEVGRRLKDRGSGVYIDAPVSVSQTTISSYGKTYMLMITLGWCASSRSWHSFYAHRSPCPFRIIITPRICPLYARLAFKILLSEHSRRRSDGQDLKQLSLWHNLTSYC